MNLFDLTLQLKGFPINKAKQDLLNLQNLAVDSYQDTLNAKKKAIVSHHLAHNPFYKKFVNTRDTSQWENIPVITKADLQIPLQQRLSKGFTTKNCHLHKTSGSSGTPLIFAKDKYAHALTWANFIDRYSWYNINAATSKQARFYGIPLNTLGYYKERFKDLLANRFRFSVFDLSPNIMAKNVEKFEHTAFDYINGYTSVIVQFAKYLASKQLVLKELCPSLKVCIVTAEMLFDNDKKLLETTLGIPIVNEYGSAELGLIAFNTPDDKWQVNAEDLFVEILDANGNVLPYGEEGRIVITALYNKAHPFIRYDIGDIGALHEDSTLRKPILKHLVGRTSDIAILPSGKSAAGLTFYYITKTVIEDHANVKEFIIEQHAVDTFKICYTSEQPLNTEKKNAIMAAITKYLEPNLQVSFEKTEVLQRSKSGKLKQFTSFIDSQSA